MEYYIFYLIIPYVQGQHRINSETHLMSVVRSQNDFSISFLLNIQIDPSANGGRPAGNANLVTWG
jgi:hypothetical protein